MRRLWLVLSLSGTILFSTPFDFMSTVGIRGMALSGSVSGVLNDPSMMFYNPAVLGFNQFSGGSLGYSYQGQGLSLLSGAYVYRTPIGTFGAGFAAQGNYFGMPDGRLQGDTTGIDLNGLVDSDILLALGYSLRFGFFSFGLNMKYMNSTVAGFTDRYPVIGMDAGVFFAFNVLSKTARKDLMLGLSLRNFGPGLNYMEENMGPSTLNGWEQFVPIASLTVSEYVPLIDTTFSASIDVTPAIGRSYATPSEFIKKVFGIDHYVQTPLAVRIGVDMFEDAMFSPRFGMNINPNDLGFSWGLGFNRELFKLRWSLEYAMSTSVSLLTRNFELHNGFGMTVRGMAMPMFNIPSEVLFFPEALITINDKFSPKAVEAERTAVAVQQKRYVIDIKRFGADNDVRAKQGFLEQIEQAVREKIVKANVVTVFDGSKGMNGADVSADVFCDVAIEGELLSFVITYKHPRTQKVLLKNSISQSISFDREKKSYDALKAVVRNGKVVLVTDESSAAENKDLAYVESISQEGAKSIADSIAEAIAGKITVRCTVADADVYLDGKRMGAISGGALTFRAADGDHVISVTKGGYPPFSTDPPIAVQAGEDYTVNAELKQTDFFTAVNIYSFPEGRPVSMDDKSMKEKTSFVAKKVKNGKHQYYITDSRGGVRERAVDITKDLFYNVYEIFSASDNFRNQNKLLWRRLTGDESVNIRNSGAGLMIQGKTEDSRVTGNGLSTPLFPVNGIVEVEIAFSSSGENKAALYAGLIDEQKRGYLMRFQNEAISKQAYGLENPMEQSIPAARVQDPGAAQKVKIVYDLNAGTVIMTANEVKLYDEKCSLSKAVRFVLYADSLKEGDPVHFVIDNVRIENY